MKRNGYRGDARPTTLPALAFRQRLCLQPVTNQTRCILGRFHKGKCRDS